MAANIAAINCSLNEVSTAITSASDGDTVNIPAGICTWSASLTISKSITLSGAGGTLTQINHDFESPTITISPPTDVPVRITGIYFNKVSSNNGTKPAIKINGKDYDGARTALTKIRIDHNTFRAGDRTLLIYGYAYGVADHNQFNNCNIAIGPIGDGYKAWERPIEAGTVNSFYIEDNTFYQDNNVQYVNEQIYHNSGARTVIRHNTFDGTKSTNKSYLPLDSHGNQNYWDINNVNARYMRGQPLIEFYNNKVHTNNTYRMLHIRGGSFLIHNNEFINDSGPTTWLAFEEEESYQTAFFNPLRSSWPAEDQINNTFIWNNTGNGSPITEITLGESQDALFIKKDRDYFMHAPQQTGGKANWPDRKGSANMIFTNSTANAYFPYNPFTYPHPLQNISSAKEIQPPLNLRIVSP